MGAPASAAGPLRSGLLTILSAGLLLGCGGDGRDGDPLPAPAASDAETVLGAELLPPDGQVAAAALPPSELPPDVSAAAEPVAGDDLPP